MKKTMILVALIVFTVFGRIRAEPAPDSRFQQSIQGQLDALELAPLFDFTEILEEEYRAYLPQLSFRELLAGNLPSSTATEFLGLLLRNLLREVYLSQHLLRQLVAVGMLAALLDRLSRSFGVSTVLNLAFAVCFLILMVIGLQSFQAVLAVASGAVHQMVDFMYSLLPILQTLLIAVGGVTSSTVLHPVLWGLVAGIASLVEYLLFPLILLSAAFSLLTHFAPDLPFSKLGSFLRQSAITLLGAFFIVFSGFMVVRGAIAPIADGISLRAAKYLTKTFVPVAGSMFADALEVVAGGSLLIKNGVGVFGMVMVFLLVATPLLKVLAMLFLYKAVGILLEPICDQRLILALGTMEHSLALVFAALATVALMFLLWITILVGVGNLAVFMR